MQWSRLKKSKIHNGIRYFNNESNCFSEESDSTGYHRTLLRGAELRKFNQSTTGVQLGFDSFYSLHHLVLYNLKEEQLAFSTQTTLREYHDVFT